MNIFKITLLGSLIVLNSCNKQTKAEKADERKKIDEVYSEFEAINEQSKKKIEEEGYYESDSTKLDKIISATDKLKDSETDEARLFKILGAEMKVMKSKMVEFEQEQVGVIEALDLSTLKEQKNFEERIKLLDKAIKANQKFKEYATVTYYKNIIASANATDLPDQVKKNFRLGIESGGKKDKQVKFTNIIRDSEIELCETFKDQINLLKDNVDTWTWNADTELVDISDPEVEKKYNANITELQVASKRQVDAQKALLNIQ